MRQYGKMCLQYFVLICKRMCRTPGYVFCFLFVPCILLGVHHLTQTKESYVCVAVAIEESANEEDALFLEQLKNALQQKKGMIQFVICDSEQEVMERVAKAEAECGYFVPNDLFSCLERGRYKRMITAYMSPQTSLQTLCNEVFFAEVFATYEKMTFGNQMEELFLTNAKDDISKEATQLYETYLYNGSTFAFSYEAFAQPGNGEESQEQQFSRREQEAGSVFRIREIGAWVLFICALCGTLDCIEDLQKQRTSRLKYKKTFRVLTIYVPICVMSVLYFVCFMATGNANNIGSEILRLAGYQIVLVLYCFLLTFLWKAEEKFAAVMPVFILASAVVCPVFVDLTAYIPVFKLLEKLFPITYYLA